MWPSCDHHVTIMWPSCDYHVMCVANSRCPVWGWCSTTLSLHHRLVCSSHSQNCGHSLLTCRTGQAEINISRCYYHQCKCQCCICKTLFVWLFWKVVPLCHAYVTKDTEPSPVLLQVMRRGPGPQATSHVWVSTSLTLTGTPPPEPALTRVCLFPPCKTNPGSCDDEDTFRGIASPVDYSLVVVVSPEVGCGTNTTGSGGRLALVEPVWER